MEEAWELAVVSDEKKNKLKTESLPSKQQRKSQKTLILAFLSAVLWMVLAVIFVSFSSENFWQTEFAVLFDEDGDFLLYRLFAIIAGFLALISFVIAYAAMLGDLKKSTLSTFVTKFPALLLEVASAGVGIAGVVNANSNEDTSDDDSEEAESDLNDIFPFIESVEYWYQPIISAKIRLKEEEFRLNQNSFTNLLWGIVVSTAALAALVWTIITSDTSSTPSSFVELLYQYGPRLTFVLFSQILAVFFLKLHVTAQNELTKIRNEITNLDLRLAAGLLVGSSAANKQRLAEKLIVEERNFIIKKNEKSSIDSDLNSSSNFLKEIKSLIETLKP